MIARILLVGTFTETIEFCVKMEKLLSMSNIAQQPDCGARQNENRRTTRARQCASDVNALFRWSRSRPNYIACC